MFKKATRSIFLLPADYRVSTETCPEPSLHFDMEKNHIVCFERQQKMLWVAQLVLGFLLFIFSYVK